MYINNINILYLALVGIIGLFVGQFTDWCIIRFLEEKKVFTREFFSAYMPKHKVKFGYMSIMAILYILILCFNGFTIKTLAFLILSPMLLIAFVIDYKETIIPNRLNLTIFEVGLVYTFIEGITNINVAIDMILGMFVGAGLFLLITLIGGLMYGKEAMGMGDVKLMGALGLFFGLRMIIIVSLIAFLLGAIIGVIVMIVKKGKDAYMPFGPCIVIGATIAMLVPFNILFIVMLKIFTLGTFKLS